MNVLRLEYLYLRAFKLVRRYLQYYTQMRKHSKRPLQVRMQFFQIIINIISSSSQSVIRSYIHIHKYILNYVSECFG